MISKAKTSASGGRGAGRREGLRAARGSARAPAAGDARGKSQPDLLALAVVDTNDGLWDWDARTDRVYRSARLQEILGLTAESHNAAPEDWRGLVHPDDLEGYRKALRALFKSDSDHFTCEYRVRRADGAYRWLLDRALVLRDGRNRVCRMAGSVSDITERKQMEAALRESEQKHMSMAEALRDSEQRFRDYAETGSDWYWETDAEHRFTEDSAGAMRRPLRDRCGRRRWEFAADFESEPTKWRAHIATLERRAPFRDFVYQVQRPDGSIQYVWISGKPVFDKSGGFVGYRGSGRDVTEDVLSGQALRRAKQDAEAANAAKSQFLANMSHELRTPLNAILGFSEIISREMLGPLGHPRYREYAEDILRSGRHLLDVISDILDMSKIEAGKLELHEEWIALPALVQACLPFLRQRADEAKVAIETAIPADLPALRVDETRLKQILLNLLTNAVKFTPSGGLVSLSAGLEPAGAVRIVVSDTGIGMDEQGIALALEPFHQVDNSAAKRFEGTGLGLPLTKSLAELHGGTIEIASAPGQGTRVTVRLPAERVGARPAEAC